MTDVSTTTPDEQYGQEYRATYSPDDNKLRLYALHRLDEDTYAKVSAAGYKWAPKQKFFVARHGHLRGKIWRCRWRVKSKTDLDPPFPDSFCILG